MRLIPSTISKKANVACFQSHRLKSWESCSKVTSNAIRPNYWNTRYTMSVSGSSTASVDTIELRRTVEDALDLMKLNIKTIPSREIIVNKINDLERETSEQGFWEGDPKRTKLVNSELSKNSELLERLNRWDELAGECSAAVSLLDELFKSDEDDKETIDMISEECQIAATDLIEDGKAFELKSLLNGPFDQKSARINFIAGAGGTEACDWVEMLLRMYTRHAKQMGYTVSIDDTSSGDVVGYKSVEITVTGENAYGWLRGEKGAHRLVRLSPFNSNNKRQTTFAGVDVVPVLEDEEINDITISEGDLDISFMKSGGKGGQNVNKVESGVRIKHIPTGLNIKCTEERSQLQNRNIAMKRLKSQLLAIAQEQKCEEIKAIRGDVIEAAWGLQIRNYVLHPYKMVKDQRTNWETNDAQSFLDGDMNDCIGELLRARAKEMM